MKPQLLNTFKKTPKLKVAHSNLPVMPKDYVPVPGAEKQKLNPPHFADATRDAQGNRIEHKMSIFHLVFVR